MSLGADERDSLAHDLVTSDFDAVERGGYRAAWTADDTAIEVTRLDSGEVRRYDAEDLVRAASDREVRNAREPTGR